MAKIMLVEDDNSLREIYEARLAAEGYEVVSAKDGEEALALALKEHPDLIIADIMMPKVSGFDMLDILRSTPETKNTKIIMMTALSQAEDRARAEKLGADRYLVKSQVTLEDVTREAREIIEELDTQAAATVAKVSGEQPAPLTPTTAPAPSTPAPPASAPAPAVPTPPAVPTTAPTPPAAPEPTATPVKPAPEPPKPEPPKPEPPTPAPAPTPAPTPKVTSIPVTAAPSDTDDSKSSDTTSDNSTDAQQAKTEVDDKTLEEAAKALSKPDDTEKKEINEQVDEFIASNPTLSASPDGDQPQETPNKDTASAAVDSLTKGKETEKNESTDRGYVAEASDDGQAGSSSLKHTKTIEPTPEATKASEKPNLAELLAKEGESGESAPPVNSIISPNDTGGTPPPAS